MDKTMFFQVWGSELRRVREAAGLSQAELAVNLQTTQKQISRVEGGSNITLETIYRWYVACNTAVPLPDETGG